MPIYKRGDVWHYDFTRDGQRYRGTTGLVGKAAAARKEKQLQEQAALAESGPELTIETVAIRWFTARMAEKRSAKTTGYRLQIMLRLIGPDTLISRIDSPEIEDAIQRRRLETTHNKRVPTNATVNRDLIDATLRPIFRYAKRVLKLKVAEVEWGELKLTEPKDRVRQFTKEEMAAWREALPEWHRQVFDFMSVYGVRLREAFFPLSAVEPEAGRIVIRGEDRKNKRPHSIPLLPDDAKMVRALYARALKAELKTLWFKEEADGSITPIHWRGFQSASKTAQIKVGILDARPAHELRHHAGTAAMRATGNLKAVQKLLGHENIASTARYAHADDSDVLAALMKVKGIVATARKIRERKVKPL